MIFLLLLWIIFILICICTSDVHALIANLEISFSFTLTPDWSNFLRVYSPASVSLFEMTGHFMLFFVLTYLLLSVFKDAGKVVVIAVTFAIFTEVLQIYFGRGAEVYDIAADVVGVFVMTSLVSIRHAIFQELKEKEN